MVTQSLIDDLPGSFLAGSPLLRAIAPADRALVSAASHILTCGPSEMVYRQGEASRALGIVLEGQIKLSGPSVHGRELVVSVLGRGQSFGEIGCFDGEPRSLDATALRHSRVLLVGRAALLDAMARTPALAMAFAAALCRRLRRTTGAVQQAVFYGVEPRLADCLLRLAGEQADTVAVWQHELAAMLGVTRESVNKRLRRWQAEGIITIGRGSIRILRRTSLAALVPEGAQP